MLLNFVVSSPIISKMRFVCQGLEQKAKTQRSPAILSSIIRGLMTHQGLEGWSQKDLEGKGALNYLMFLRAWLLLCSCSLVPPVLYCLPHLVLGRILTLQTLARPARFVLELFQLLFPLFVPGSLNHQYPRLMLVSLDGPALPTVSLLAFFVRICLRFPSETY